MAELVGWILAIVVIVVMVLAFIVIDRMVRPDSGRSPHPLRPIQDLRQTPKRRFPDPRDSTWSGPGWSATAIFGEHVTVAGDGLPTATAAYWHPFGRVTAEQLRTGFEIDVGGASVILTRPRYGLRRSHRTIHIQHPDGATWYLRAWDALAVGVLREDGTPVAIYGPFRDPVIDPKASPAEIALVVCFLQLDLFFRVHCLGNFAALVMRM